MRKLLRENRGFTLVELIVALAIMGVIAVAASLMIVTAIRANNTALLIANARSNSAAAVSLIKSNLLYSGAAELRNDTDGASERYIYAVSDPEAEHYGHIVIESADGSVAELYDQTGLETLLFELTFSAEENRMVTVSLRVHDAENVKTYVSLSTAFQLVNLSEADGILLDADVSDLDGDGNADGAVLGFDGL